MAEVQCISYNETSKIRTPKEPKKSVHIMSCSHAMEFFKDRKGNPRECVETESVETVEVKI